MELQLRGASTVQSELEWLWDAVRESYGPLGRYEMFSIVLHILNVPGHSDFTAATIIIQVVSSAPIPRS